MYIVIFDTVFNYDQNLQCIEMNSSRNTGGAARNTGKIGYHVPSMENLSCSRLAATIPRDEDMLADLYYGDFDTEEWNMPTNDFWNNLEVANPNIICIRNNNEFKESWSKFHAQRPSLFGPEFNLEEHIAIQVGQVWADAFHVDVQHTQSKYCGPNWDYVLVYIKEGSNHVSGVCALEFRVPVNHSLLEVPYLYIDALAVNADDRKQNIGRSLCGAAGDIATMIWNDLDTHPETTIWYNKDTNPFKKMYLALNVDISDKELMTPIYEKLGFHVATHKEDDETTFEAWAPFLGDWDVNTRREFRMIKDVIN
jgi:hypothetical protein